MTVQPPQNSTPEPARATVAPQADEVPEVRSLGRKPGWGFAAKNAVAEFTRDQCTDLAAALTYYAVLAVFPAVLALVSLLGVFGEGERTVLATMDLLGRLIPAAALEQVQPVITGMVETRAAGFALVVGLLGALWSASGYVNAFSRAMNRVYDVEEGRPIWRLRPLFLGLTFVMLLGAALVMVGLVISGPLARALGDLVGLGDAGVLLWNVAKWPAMLLVVMMLVALLYFVTPNVRQPKFRWLSLGAFIAILIWVFASVAFGFYVANFGSYNKTYGALAGVVVALLWMWITNLALLFGAEFDAELERSRQLQEGVKAERSLQLPPRDTTVIAKAAAKRDEQIEQARRLRLENQAAGRSEHESAD